MTKLAGIFRNPEETKQVPTGAVIFSEGDPGTEMYGVISGEVQLQVRGNVVATIGPDDVFGEMALVDHEPRMATAVASQPTELAVLNERRFLFLVGEAPMFALQVMSTMADRLRNV